MKNKKYRRTNSAFGCWLLAFSLALVGCMDFDDATQAISVKVQVQMPEALKGADVSGRTVTLNLGGKSITIL